MTEQTEETNLEQTRLYAGKFNNVEDLEAAYKKSFPTFQENEALKKQLADATHIPDQYMKPDDVDLDATRLTNLQQRAKEAGMTQVQYDKFLRSEKSAIDARQNNFEAARKEVGEETINVLKDYVNKNYPEALRDNMLNTFIGNKDARNAALQHREQLLNSSVPGVQKTSAPQYSVTDDDVRKAYDAKTKNPNDLKAREHYLKMVSAKASQMAS